jgi:hypothetical protein
LNQPTIAVAVDTLFSQEDSFAKGVFNAPGRWVSMAKTEFKDFSSPDETRSFEKGKLALAKIGGGVVGRFTLQPGWRWSLHVKPIVKTDWCEAPHFQYQISGHLHVLMSDGKEYDTHAGQVYVLPQGHDAWVVGDEEVVLVDWSGAGNYALS